ncbi:reverse transcriptase domain-containing protein [Desulfovulcanus sp.]
MWSQIVSWDNLLAAYMEARRGKRHQADVLEFKWSLEENLIQIQNELTWHTWIPGRWREFYVYDPKKRLICAPPFRDRVVHHALVRIIEPLFERKFIYDSYACRKRKGTHAAVQKLQSFLRRAKRNWGKVYVLKADVAKYFPSINHERLLYLLSRTIRDKEVLWLCRAILDTHTPKGIPVGALTSQLFANIYLNHLDHFIKNDLSIKYYVRYMDDFVILGHSKQTLRDLLYQVETFLVCELCLMLNPKTSIFPAYRGVDFAGYRIWATHILPRKRNVRKARKKLKQLAMAYTQGEIGLDYVRPSLMSFLGYMKHCASYVTLRSILKNFTLNKKTGKEG